MIDSGRNKLIKYYISEILIWGFVIQIKRKKKIPINSVKFTSLKVRRLLDI